MGTAEVWPAGVTARAIERGDAQAWADLLAAVEKVDQEGENYDAEDLLEELDDPSVDTSKDTLGLWADGVMVGYGSLSGPDHVVDVHRIHTEGRVHPEWRGRGLGDALISWLETRAADLHQERRPGTVGEINTGAISSNTGALELLALRGYEQARFFSHMQRPLGADPVPDSPVPAGFRIVAFDPSYDEPTRLTHNEVFLDHWGSTPKDPESWKVRYTGSRAFRPGQSFLVLDGDQIAAYSLAYEYVADTAVTGIRELYVGQVGARRENRGRGLARASLARVMQEAEQAGYQRVSLGVDADNPTGALGLYEKLGFRNVSQMITHRLPPAH